jgi:exopolysaccharide production protein ExoY
MSILSSASRLGESSVAKDTLTYQNSVSVNFPLWKRLFDLVGALLLLAFVAPILMITAIAIAMDGGNIIFYHSRIGVEGRHFRVFKFRSMHIDAEDRLAELLKNDCQARDEWERNHKLRRDPRITAVGRFLRKSSIDEFPQLINVLRGEMSIVGPRPIVQAEVVRYGHYIRQYETVRPGITGLWQVTGRSDVSYRRRVAMDTLYSRKMKNPWVDFKILLMTIPAVLLSRGSY